MQIFLTRIYYRYRNIILYCMIGCVGASLDFGIFSVLVTLWNFHCHIANIISISIGIVCNFFLNYFFNFKSKSNLLLRLISFYLVGMAGLCFSAILLEGFIDVLGMTAIPAKLVTIFFVTVLQYTLNKMISFRKGKND